MRASVAIIVALCIFANAVFASKASWYQQDRAAGNKVIPITFTLQQRNLGELERVLLDASTPSSENYGKWWAPEAILDLVAPPQADSDRVTRFLLENGAETVQNNRDVIMTSFTVEKAEALLQTRLYEWVHKNGKDKIIATDGEIITPSEIANDIDIITGVSEFPRIRNQPTKPAASAYVIPLTIQTIYNIPASFEKSNSSICVAEFQNDASYNKQDLAKFVKEMAVPEINVEHIVGPFSPSSPDAESTLDVQYGFSTAVNQTYWFWTVSGWMMEFATALFATKEAPYVVSMSWGWPEPEQCQIESCTGGLDSHKYVNRVNVEFQKLGLRGITLLAASGDQGAPGDGNAYCDNSTNPLSTIFPGASPWVISVGATMLQGQSLVNNKQQSIDATTPPICKTHKCALTNLKETTCTYPTALITTGGGFSDYSQRPSYQDAAVTAYLKSGTALPNAKFFNASNRGFPDVAALGHNYLIGISGSFEQVDGTSCSSPVFGGVIALLNAWRLNNGKTSLGFALPMLYEAWAANPAVFTDITTGNNKCTESCCSTHGYIAAKGWDPVTGLGTPNFPALLKYVQSL
eukprot:TRINITY_DN557_c0_g1_i1.p1 TRINITY_DN557_c0_g1~~TRINITY_DN557_c0_g1_i1.p1  ORF type:complete len:578 (+),score=296.43 TRINITY_DN557_c0_g1_i1:1-1734(+)